MISVIVLLSLMLTPIILAGFVITYWKKRDQSFRRRNPLSHDLLRSPGETLREQIEEVNLDIDAHLFMLLFIPPIIYSLFLMSPPNNRLTTIVTIFTYAIIGLIAFILILRKIFKNLKYRFRLSIGLDAELAIGQALNELIRQGYWVFHDFIAEEFNIDHIVVGPSGIYVVETKGRTKPIGNDGKTKWEVTYDGETLHFPDWYESKPLIQAIKQAQWLEAWLSSAVGEPVNAKPVLALPGWYIHHTSDKGIFVFNGKNPKNMLLRSSANELSPKLVTQLVHQLDQRCRNVKPKSFVAPRKS